MRGASLVLLLASVVVGSTPGWRRDEHCEYIPYPEHLPFLPENHPVTARLRQVANNTAYFTASLISGEVVDWERVSALASNVLETHPDLAASTVAVPERRLIALAYHRGSDVEVLQLVRNRSVSVSAEKYLNNSELIQTDGKWLSPFWDCLTRRWVFGYVIPLPSLNRATAGAYQYIDRCNGSLSSVFGGSHKCDLNTTQCVSDAAVDTGYVATEVGYACACLPGFFVNRSVDDVNPYDQYRCSPCQGECQECNKHGQCMARCDVGIRVVIIVLQSICMGVTLIIGILVFRKRKCKTISTGMWTILETILLGIFILYGTVIVKFFDPSKEQCLVEPWCRELGFIICYGAIILKLYRILIEFRTRKAHRWVVRDKDLLKYLLGMIVMAVGYMAAWTAATLNFIQEDYSILTIGNTQDGQQFVTCKSLWWDYVTQTGEILILIFGIHLSFACRNATTQFQERRFLCLSIVVEMLVSGAYYVLRFLYSETLHPDYIYIAYFIRSQFTSTIVLMLIFLPKLWYQHKQGTDSRGTNNLLQEASARIPIDAFKPQDGVPGSNNSDADVGDINLADMNPEDIRAELKRLYTQLEVLKNKTIRADNPHISKRRGGRKVAHRRFSLQKKGSREKALHHRHQRLSTRHHCHGDQEPTEGEVSRTPEDSVCSVEGPSAIYNDGPSTYSEMGGYPTPNVSNRGGGGGGGGGKQ